MPKMIFVNNHRRSGHGGQGILDGLGPTAAWSFSRNLLTSWGAADRYTLEGAPARISDLYDQTGNGWRMGDGNTVANRPELLTVGPNSRLAGRLNQTTNVLVSTATLGNLVTNSSKFTICSLVVHGGVTLASGNVYQTHHLFGDGASQFCGLFARNTGGTTPTFYAYNWDGNSDTPSGGAITNGIPYVLTLRHEGGNVYISVNGAAEVSVASGNTTSMAGAFRVGGLISADFSFFEGATWSSIPALGTRTAIVNAFKSWVGAA